ncbi:molybdopterin molybdotransferase MoeA [Rugamonas brunnea]|uniref:molybdopterin molybdotransferase MoeA n=1 Tax=Rugamonas brunnea TaxID=2758569 RepID=UPI0028834EB8|nr:gephyrin-like molybdotransferase Glp [Rugamonas brunnea]
MNSKVSGLILAGGRGTRMGRVDKGLQPFRGATLVAHVLQRLAPQVASVAINANRNLPQYEAYGCPVLGDELGGFEGPLAGLQTGLRHCATELLLTAPCDSPFLPPDLAQRLAGALDSQDADVAVAVTLEADEHGVVQRQLHPVFSLLRASLLPQLDAYLATGARRMEGWYKTLRLAEVVFEDAAAFRNINTLGELQQLEHAGAQPEQPLTLAAVASCLSAYDPEAMSVRDAQRIIGDFITPIQSSEKVALRSALDRVLAQDVISPINVPAYDNSAMDGYALRGADLPAEGTVTLEVIGIVYAGRPTALACGPGQCVRIMTGGAMPAGCDTVLPQELAAAIGDGSVTIAAGVLRAGDNRRFKGEDLAEGGVAIARGKVVRPADLGLIASLGLAEVAVQRRLRVAFFSTGDELRSVGEPLDTGCVYDSNRYTLFGMLQRLGCDVIDMGIVKDDTVALEAALRSGCENADAIITSGGVSDGAADYTRAMMARLGDVAFWKLNMRPGRPLAFGKIHSNGRSAWLFGLPGNPVATMVSFYFFARAALLHMMGANAPLPLLRARAQAGIRKRPGRSEFQRGVLSTDADGQPQVRLTGAQGSGILRSMSEANCMVVLRDDQGNVAQGDLVEVLPFEGLL